MKCIKKEGKLDQNEGKMHQKQSIGAPRSGALALRSGAVLPERGQSAAPGSWPGALSERRSGKWPERYRSASAPTGAPANSEIPFNFSSHKKILRCASILDLFNYKTAVNHWFFFQF